MKKTIKLLIQVTPATVQLTLEML